MMKKLFYIKYNDKYMIFKNMLQCLTVFSIINILNISFIFVKVIISQWHLKDFLPPYKIIDIMGVNLDFYLIFIFTLSLIIIFFYFIRGILIIIKQRSITELIDNIANTLYQFLFNIIIISVLIMINYIIVIYIYGLPSV